MDGLSLEVFESPKPPKTGGRKLNELVKQALLASHIKALRGLIGFPPLMMKR